MRKILQLGDPVLEQKSKKVDSVNDSKVQDTIENMLKILNKNPEQSAGLSSVQIGELIRVMICRRIDLNNDTDKTPIWEVMINPTIKHHNTHKSTFWEGCLSIRNGDLFGKVSRPSEITVEYLNRNGKKVQLTAFGYFSHVVQHELDHLDGILFIKYIKDPSLLLTGEELDKVLNKENEQIVD